MPRNSGATIDSLRHAVDQVSARLRQALMTGDRTGALRREQAEARASLAEALWLQAETDAAAAAQEADRNAAELERATLDVLMRMATDRERRFAGIRLPAPPRLHTVR